jgi:hypothetical protein
MKKFPKLFFLILSIGLLSGCAANQENQLGALRQGPIEQVQAVLRENAMINWESSLPKDSVFGETAKPAYPTSEREPVENDEANTAWRAKIAEQWKGLEGQKNLDFMCEYWFQGWQGIDDSFSDFFKEHRAQTDAMGIKIETIENIKMIEDNRKTINFPKPGKQYSLFTCEATIVFRLARPGLSKPQKSTISFVYWLENNEVKSSFSVNAGISTEILNGQPQSVS